jgi:GNAT superfamily N-acetyltransferase
MLLNGSSLTFRALTSDRWPDLERLFGPRGACAGCWCMWWRLSSSDFESGKGDGNRAALRALVDAGESPGLLAYSAADPVGWVSLGPRERFSRLARSRVLAAVDDRPVWSIVCFFMRRDHRRHGLLRVMIDGAVDYAGARGAVAVEAYPIDPAAGHRTADVFAYTGFASAFLAAGFVEVLRRSPTRPIMRYTIEPAALPQP